MYTNQLIHAINIYSNAYLKVRKIESGETHHSTNFGKARDIANANKVMKNNYNKVLEFLSYKITIPKSAIVTHSTLHETFGNEQEVELRHVPVYIAHIVHKDAIKANCKEVVDMFGALLRYFNAISYLPKQ